MSAARRPVPAPPEPGSLLLAMPELLDPNFVDTVVLILEADENGALGVVLNRPSGLAVDDVLGEWGDVVDEPEVLFQGGPVSPEGALAVALAAPGAADAAGFRAVWGRLCLLDLDTPSELVTGTVERLRIFAGYSGWGPGQLEAEIADGRSWYVVPGRLDDVFTDDVRDLWRRVMRRQPGELAFHANRPVDPALN